MRITLKMFLGAACLLTAAGAAASPVPGSFAELADMRAACRIGSWRTLQASGYDRGGGFYDSGNFVRVDPGPRYVMGEVEGPGCIDRMWFTRKTLQEPYDVCLYIDGEEEPRIRLEIDVLTGGARVPFCAPFAGQVHLARYAYVPVGFARSLKAVLIPTAPASQYQWRVNSAGERIPHVYYQLTYRVFDRDTAVRVFTWEQEAAELAARERAAALWERAGRWPWTQYGDGREKVLSHEFRAAHPEGVLALDGPGVVYGLYFSGAAAAAHLEIYWEGAARPAVAVPVGVLCAAPEGKDAGGLWMGCRAGEYYSFFPMPFRRHARVVLRRGDADGPVKLRLLYRPEEPGDDDLYFHVRRYDEHMPAGGDDYLVLDTVGRGHFAAVVMDRPGNMEGDDRFFVDGEAAPSIHGTGTEDYFNFAWGFSHIGSFPLHGITAQRPGVVCYRVSLPAKVPFRRALRVTWEHGSGNEHAGRYSGAAIYYRDAPEP